MKVLGALFGFVFCAGVFFVMRRGGAEGGRMELAFGIGLVTIAAISWMIQLVVEIVDRARRKRRPRSER